MPIPTSADDDPGRLGQATREAGHEERADDEADRGQALLQAVLELGGARGPRCENGRSRTFHRPNAKNMNAPTTNSERMIGVAEQGRQARP